jgi:cysteine-rich repeat protein
LPEYCNGVSSSCPADTKRGSGYICRPSKHATCDPSEQCDGSTNACPADALTANGVACDDGSACTDVSNCTGGYCIGVDVRCNGTCGDGILSASEQCDDHNLIDGDCCSHLCKIEPSGTVCRSSKGYCDPSETCTGSSATCPVDVLSTAICRDAVNSCDAPEYCSGSSVDCPGDSLKAAGTSCPNTACYINSTCSAQGICSGIDIYCTGICGDGILALSEQCDDGNLVNGDCCSSTCTFESASTVCRASQGVCDIPETCTGSSRVCPADARRATSYVCRPAASACDVDDYCTASGPFTCGTNNYQNSGVACDDGSTCTNTSSCNGAGACQGVDIFCQGVCGDGIKGNAFKSAFAYIIKLPMNNVMEEFAVQINVLLPTL